MTTTTLDPTQVDAIPEVRCVLEVMDSTGDTKHHWNPSVPGEVAAARAVFDTLKDKRYSIFKMKRDGESKGERMDTFDPTAERMIAVPHVVGG